MIYFEKDQPHCILFPTIAIGMGPEFWVGLAWLNLEIGYRSGDGGEGDETSNAPKVTT